MYLLLAGWLLVQPAGAAELYVSGSLGNSAGDGSVTVHTDFYDVDGQDVDASPVYGGSLGLAFPLDEALPEVRGFELPSWVVRSELEFLTGRDYELVTPAAGTGDHFLNEFDAWTLMPNLSLSVPVREGITWLFGRVPILEPMSVYGNVGIGLSSYDLKAADNVSPASTSGLGFAWQAGAGIDYQLTDTTSFVLGWRYVSLGEIDAGISKKVIAGGGDYKLDMSSNDVLASLRVSFYTAPLADMRPRNWRLPHPKLPSWLGGDSGEEASDGDDL